MYMLLHFVCPVSSIVFKFTHSLSIFFSSKLWLVGFSLGLMGLSIGPMLIPAMAELENIVKYVYTFAK